MGHYRAGISDSIERGKISFDEWATILSSIEDNGYQHIFIYTCATANLNVLCNPQHILKFAETFKLDTASGHDKFLDMPEEPTLVRALLQNNILDIKWVEKRQWKEQTAYETEETGNRIKVTVEYERKVARGTTLLRMDSYLELLSSELNDSSQQIEIMIMNLN